MFGGKFWGDLNSLFSRSIMKKNKKGIKNGTLYSILFIGLYIYSYLGLGFYFIWKTHFPNSWSEFGGILGSSVVYIVFGIILYIPVIFMAIYFFVRDRSVSETMTNHWPIVLALVYMFVPNMPGPIDEIVVVALGLGFDFYKWKLSKKVNKERLKYSNRNIEIENE